MAFRYNTSHKQKRNKTWIYPNNAFFSASFSSARNTTQGRSFILKFLIPKIYDNDIRNQEPVIIYCSTACIKPSSSKKLLTERIFATKNWNSYSCIHSFKTC